MEYKFLYVLQCFKFPVKEIDFWNVPNNGLYGVLLLRVNCIYEFAKFSSQIYVKSFKNTLKIDFFSLFFVISYGENRGVS